MMQSRIGGEWIDSYSFDLGHVTPQDIEVGNFYTSQSPASKFTRVRIASRPREEGRVSLSDFTLTEISGEEKQSAQIAAGDPYMLVLREQFGIELDAPYEALRPCHALSPHETT